MRTMTTVRPSNLELLKPGVRISWPGSGGQHTVIGAPYPRPTRHGSRAGHV